MRIREAITLLLLVLSIGRLESAKKASSGSSKGGEALSRDFNQVVSAEGGQAEYN